MLVSEQNTPIFDFFRRRHRNVVLHAEKDEIETYVLWGVAVAALTRLHARRLGKPDSYIRQDRICFIEGLIDLQPMMKVISVPLLADGARSIAPRLRKEHVSLATYVDEREYARLWQVAEDVAAFPSLQSLEQQQTNAKVKALFRSCRYAEILYAEIRCAVVHGLDFGDRVETWHFDPSADIAYMNYTERATRTPIYFSPRYLCKMLDEIISKIETECNNSGWVVPSGSTRV